MTRITTDIQGRPLSESQTKVINGMMESLQGVKQEDEETT